MICPLSVTAMFWCYRDRRRLYRHIALPPAIYRHILVEPGTAEGGTAEKRKTAYRHIALPPRLCPPKITSPTSTLCILSVALSVLQRFIYLWVGCWVAPFVDVRQTLLQTMRQWSVISKRHPLHILLLSHDRGFPVHARLDQWPIEAACWSCPAFHAW